MSPHTLVNITLLEFLPRGKGVKMILKSMTGQFKWKLKIASSQSSLHQDYYIHYLMVMCITVAKGNAYSQCSLTKGNPADVLYPVALQQPLIFITDLSHNYFNQWIS